jgi:hypothetical protein
MGEIRQSIEIQSGNGNYIRVNALFDSGASHCYLNKKFEGKIPLPNLGSVKLNNSDGKSSIGYNSIISVSIRGKLGYIGVTVCELGEDLLLGQDFLQENNVILNFKKDKFILGKVHSYKKNTIYKL